MSVLVALLIGASPVLSLPELKARHAELNGQIVRVRGFIGKRCEGEDCSLSSKPTPPRVGWGGTLLSIGEDKDFDRRVRPLLGHEIVIEARFDDSCMQHRTFCTDRAPELRPVAGAHILPVESK